MTQWFVRPDASHGGANSGASWDDAWHGLSAVVWGAAGVGPGDTLLICGTHRYGHAADASNTVEGNVAVQCTARIVNVGTPEVTLDARGNLSVD